MLLTDEAYEKVANDGAAFLAKCSAVMDGLDRRAAQLLTDAEYDETLGAASSCADKFDAALTELYRVSVLDDTPDNRATYDSLRARMRNAECATRSGIAKAQALVADRVEASVRDAGARGGVGAAARSLLVECDGSTVTVREIAGRLNASGARWTQRTLTPALRRAGFDIYRSKGTQRVRNVRLV